MLHDFCTTKVFLTMLIGTIVFASVPRVAIGDDTKPPIVGTSTSAPTSNPTASTSSKEVKQPAVIVVDKQPASDKQEWWQALLVEALKLFMTILVPILGVLSTTLLRRWKIDIELQQVQKIAKAAAGWAEQKALAALKDGKEKMAGAQKMKIAMDFAVGLVKQYKLPTKAVETLSDMIESHLGREKVKAAANAPTVITTEPTSIEEHPNVL